MDVDEMKEHLYCLIQEKQEAVKKLQNEIQLLLMTYHCLPEKEEVLDKQKHAYEEYMTNFIDGKVKFLQNDTE